MNQINIDLERVLSDIDRNVFGGYMELGSRDTRFEYLDIGDSPGADKSVLRNDVRNALERVKLANMRFPGGNFASGYRWMDGVGPRQERPTRHDIAQYSIVANQYGTNEFILLCRAMNIAPYLCVNCGDGDMREAADWVEYCNGTGDTALVKLRQKHGFDEPHKVKYWGIGNEVDNVNQVGHKTPEEYARAYTEFSKVMKRVDPEIKLVASSVCVWENFTLGASKSEWVERAQLMLEQAGDRIDYMAIHNYTDTYDDDPFETYMAFAMDYNERLSAYDGLIRAVSLERGIKHHIGIAVDEWGVSHKPSVLRNSIPINITVDEWGNQHLPESSRNVRLREKRVIGLQDALVTGLYLNAFIRHASSVRMANFTPMPTMLGMNFRPGAPLVLPTIFYPFELYSRTCERLALDVSWKGDTFSGTYKGRAYTGIRTLDVAATLDTINKRLVVYVINQDKEKSQETTISLASGEFTGNVQVSVINGPDIQAENTEDKPNQVVTRDASAKVSGKSFTYTLEPHSVTALICTVK